MKVNPPSSDRGEPRSESALGGYKLQLTPRALEVLEGEGLQDRSKPRQGPLWLGMISRSSRARWSSGSPGGRGPPGPFQALPGRVRSGCGVSSNSAVVEL